MKNDRAARGVEIYLSFGPLGNLAGRLFRSFRGAYQTGFERSRQLRVAQESVTLGRFERESRQARRANETSEHARHG